MSDRDPPKQGLGKYWLISVGLHIGVVLALMIGAVIPHTMPDVAPPPIYVEFAPVAEKAMAPTEGKMIQSTEKKEPDPPKKEEEKPKPKTALDQVLDTPKKEEKKAEKEPEKAKKDTAKAKESPDAKKKKEPEKKEEKKEAEKKTEDSQQSFDKLLKNLSESEPDTKAGEQNVKAAEQVDGPSGLPDYAAQLTMSEFDALRAQLARCWNIPAGAQDAENLVIEVKVEVNQDRVATSASVVDQIRYASDTFFRAAADSAVRAVKAPECTPLELPPEKYNSWKSMIVTFDPREMF